MPYEKEVAEALRFLGLTGSEVATPDLIDKARQFIYLQGLIHHSHRQQEQYFERVSNFSGNLCSALEKLAPPLKPVRDLLEEAMLEAHVPGHAIRGLFYRPWNVIMDFAFPATRLCVMVGDLDRETRSRLKVNEGWVYMHLTDDEIQRDPTACARKVKKHYLQWKLFRVGSRS